jgi:hypothetical protein
MANAEVEYECSLFDRHARRRCDLVPPQPPQCCGRPMIIRASAGAGTTVVDSIPGEKK